MPTRGEVKARWARLTRFVPAGFLIAYLVVSVLLIAACVWGLCDS